MRRFLPSKTVSLTVAAVLLVSLSPILPTLGMAELSATQTASAGSASDWVEEWETGISNSDIEPVYVPSKDWVITAGTGGKLAIIDASTGDIIEETGDLGGQLSDVSYDTETNQIFVYYSGDTTEVKAFNHSLSEQWSKSVDTDASVAFDEEKNDLYVYQPGSETLEELERSDGTVKDSASAKFLVGGSSPSIVAQSGNIYGSNGESIVKYNSSLDLVWNKTGVADFPNHLSVSPDSQKVIFGNDGGSHVISGKDGSVMQNLSAGGYASVATNERVYLRRPGNENISAVWIDNGTVDYTYQTDFSIRQFALNPNPETTELFVGDGSGALHKYDTGDEFEFSGPKVDGRVTQNGTAVSNATVVAEHDNSIVGTTNESGYFDFATPYNNGQGVNITAYKAGYAESSTVKVTSDGTQNLSLGEELSDPSTGSVLTGYQEPAAGAKVEVVDPGSGDVLETTYADANGEYSVTTTGDVELVGSQVGRFDDEITADLPGAIEPLYLTEDTPAREGYDADVTDPIVGGDLDSLNTSGLSSDCEALFGESPELEAGLNILTGGYSGAADALGLVEIGPDSCRPSTQEQERLALLVGAATTNQSEQNTQAVLGNYLTDARQTAYSEGKLSAWNAIANNATEEQAKIEANTSADGYYHSMQDNLASVYATSASNAEYTYSREYNQTDATGEWVYPVYDNGTETNFAANPWVTAEIDLPMGTVEMRTYRLEDGSVVTPYPNKTSVAGGGPYVAGPKLHVEGPANSSDTLSGGAYTVVADSGKFADTNDRIEDQRAQVKDNLALFINETMSTRNASEINASDVLSPAQIASRASTDYDSTGYYGFAAAELAAQGKAGNLSMSHTVVLGDGSEVEGTLFYTGNSENLTLTQGKMYEPGNYSGTFILAANKDEGGIQELTSPFKIKEQRNTKTGEVVNTTSVERYTYNTTSTGNFSSDIQSLEQLAAAYEEQQTLASSGGPGCIAACGDGSSLLPKRTVIGAAFGILVVLLVANRS